MAEEFLDETHDDLDDSMEDILDDSFEDFSKDTLEEDLDEPDGEGKSSFFKRLFKKNAGSKKNIIIIVSGCVLLLIMIGAGLMFFLNGGDKTVEDDSKAHVQTDSQSGDLPQAAEIIFEDIVDLEPFERIRLKSSSSMGMVSINLSLELTDHRYRKQIYSMEGRIRKIITDQVAETTWLELRNPEGKILLKYNLLKRINSIFPKATVRNVYFTYFVMQ